MNNKDKELCRKNLYVYSNVLLARLHIDNKLKQNMLFEMFGKWSRKQLTLDELEQFITRLELMDNSQAPYTDNTN
ncbi:MAG: hypothetical protein QW076_02445 [Candidatus Anstonellales archaeon]